jgi:hypothetical protein
MNFKTLMSPILIGATFIMLSLPARADTIEPGSLLVFPNFDNTRGELTLLTVTNANSSSSIRVEFVYINGQNCQEFNRLRTLTPNDEISVLTKFDNPNMVKGYCYVFAQSPTTGQATSFNFLIGTELVFANVNSSSGQGGTGLLGIYEVNPWTFKAIPPQGSSTNVTPNGLRDLNGVEYQAAPDRLLFPRFFGQGGPLAVKEDLVLINLSGGALFNTIVDFEVFNDNEEGFSAQYSFQCWARVSLSDISGAFNNDFLLTTNHNTGEVPGTTSANFNETGWYEIDGDVASSSAAQFIDPAILASQIEGVAGSLQLSIGGSILPFTQGTQTNGSLLSHNLLGN